MEEWVHPLRALLALAITLLLVLLRLEAETFGAAEFDEPARDGRGAPLLRRLSWYVLGLGLVAALLLVHPDPAGDLGLGLGDRGRAIVLGFAGAALGTLQAAAFATYRYGRIRFPPAWTYPGAVLNAVGTAFLDEAAFRGAILGMLLLGGLDPLPAVVIQALLYALATRTGAPGRSRYMLALTLGIGLFGGWLTVLTGAIGASFLAHAVTRIAVFVTTGHAGRPALRGEEVEESWEYRQAPPGWHSLDRPDGGGGARS
ncbi:MAG: CPBP family intramembrane metalloprotease [Chloroflexi bacterium]|nr:CPBP family intramembrane metalloprotease [Chloroflexota bacterium]